MKRAGSVSLSAGSPSVPAIHFRITSTSGFIAWIALSLKRRGVSRVLEHLLGHLARESFHRVHEALVGHRVPQDEVVELCLGTIRQQVGVGVGVGATVVATRKNIVRIPGHERIPIIHGSIRALVFGRCQP